MLLTSIQKKLLLCHICFNFDTGNVTSMYGMFSGCEKLERLNVTHFDTSNVTLMYGMFNGCSSLTELDVTYFDTSKVTRMEGMFRNCYNLTSLDLSNFNTSSARNMSGMFGECTSLTVLDISNFDTSALDGSEGWLHYLSDNTKLINIDNMFYKCKNLETLKIGEKFSTLNGRTLFQGTDSLERIITFKKADSLDDIMTPFISNYLGELSTRILYVPDQATEALYEADATYMSLLGADRIQPIMSIVGSNPITVEGGSTYGDAEDEGVTVLKLGETNKANYNSLGFTTTTSGLPVNTNTPDDKTVIYNLYYNGNLMDTQQRIIVIEGGNYLVGESYYQTLEAAINAISSTGTIYVMKDNEDASNAVIPSTKNITLDLGTATITKTVSGIVNEGTLTIIGEGTIQTLEADVNEFNCLIDNWGELTIENGQYIHKGYVPDQWRVIIGWWNSTTNINGGIIKTTKTDGVNTVDYARTIYVFGKNAELNINGGLIINEKNNGMLIGTK